jgi:hypothetical protein
LEGSAAGAEQVELMKGMQTRFFKDRMTKLSALCTDLSSGCTIGFHKAARAQVKKVAMTEYFRRKTMGATRE